MADKEINPNVSNVRAVRDERNGEPSLAMNAVRLRQNGLSYQQIGKKLGISKSKAWRLLNNREAPLTTSIKVQPPLEWSDIAPLPSEPLEVMSDLELKEIRGRLKTENEIRRLRARARRLDYIAQHPESSYQYHMERNGGGRNRGDDDFKDKILLQLFKERSQQQNKGQNVGFKDLLTSILQLQGNQAESNWKFYQSMVETLEKLKPTSMDGQTAVALKKMELDLEKWKIERQSDAEKWGALSQLGQNVSQAVPEIVNAWTGRRRNPNTTQIRCPSCKQPFPASIKDVRQGIPLECPNCGAQLHQEPIPQTEHKEISENEQVANSPASD